MRMKISNSIKNWKTPTMLTIRRKKSSREKKKDMLSSWRNKKVRKNIPIDHQIVSLNKERWKTNLKYWREWNYKITSLAILPKHFKRTCPTSRVFFHNQCKWWLVLTLTLFSIDSLIIIKRHITNRQGVTLKVLLMLEK